VVAISPSVFDRRVFLFVCYVVDGAMGEGVR
jgi:hypothetical protein